MPHILAHFSDAARKLCLRMKSSPSFLTSMSGLQLRVWDAFPGELACPSGQVKALLPDRNREVQGRHKQRVPVAA
jgi:hypothetical protein